MIRRAMLPFLILLAAGCEQQVISRRDSLSDQFAQMNRQGWAVDDTSRVKAAPAAADPNVRVIHSADFSGYQFHTNFQTNDPHYQPPAASANTSVPASVQPAPDPWSVGLPSGGR